MNLTELMSLIARREQHGLSTTRVTLSTWEMNELRRSVAEESGAEMDAGTMTGVFAVDICVDDDVDSWEAE